jgi:2-amino-4-hydroxy-6-hydroxymethyldihydropteridine diphosphokinase
MRESHLAYLSLGSNIQPEINLVKAIQLLQDHGRIDNVSNAWESKSVGAKGPNYLNACVMLATSFKQTDLKRDVLLPIEMELGRRRSENKFAPRTIDIDIVLFDDELVDEKYWEQAFVVIPLAELYPEYQNPLTHESILEAATRLRKETWIEARQGILSQFNGNRPTA